MLRSITVVWTDTDAVGVAPVYLSQLRSSWRPGDDLAPLLLGACRAHPQSSEDQLAVLAKGHGRVLAVLEGWPRPLHVADLDHLE